MPHVPVLKDPTRRQAQAAHDIIAGAINRQVTGRTGRERQQSRDQIIRDIQTDPRLKDVKRASSHYARALERRNAIVVARGSAPSQQDVLASLRRIAGARTPGVKPLSSRPVATPALAGTRRQHLEGLRQAALSYGSKDAGGLTLSRRSQEIRAGRAQARYARATNRYKAIPAPKARTVALGPASVNITPALTKLGAGAAAALAQTSLNVGDIGPRNFANAIGDDVKQMGTGAFVGLYGLGQGIYDQTVRGDPRRLQELGTGTAKGTYETFRHPVRSAQQDPLITALTFAGGIGAVGRIGGALARGAGSTAASGGLRGALARAGSDVRPPIAYSADAARGGLKERSYSRDLIRKSVQVANDARREPLRHPDGSVVTVTRRGREVPVLAPKGVGGGTLAEVERMGRKQADYAASAQQSAEYHMRDAANKAFRVSGLRGQHAKDLVAMVVEGTVRSEKTFRQDLQAYRDMVQGELTRHEAGDKVFRTTRELREATAQVARIDRILADKRVEKQIPKIVALGQDIGRRLNEGEGEAKLLGMIDPARASRARLIHPAVLHMGAKHFDADEVRALHGPLLDTAKAAVSDARARHAAIEQDITRLEHERSRAGGRHQVHRGQSAESQRIYKVGQHEFDTHAKAAAYAKKHGGDVQTVAKTIAESKRIGEISRLDRAIKARKEDLAKARDAVKQAEKQHRHTEQRMPAHGSLRRGNGDFITDAEIADMLRATGRDPRSVAYLPPGTIGRSAFHRRFNLSRPTIAGGKGTRTGEQFRRGLTGATAQTVREQGVKLAVTTQKGRGVDRVISEHGLTHPSGRYFTGKEAEEYAARVLDDTGERLTPVRALPASADAEMHKLARGEQSPTAMENLSSRLLNDRVNPGPGAKNVVLVPSALVERLQKHAAPSSDLVKVGQWINRPFRAAVLPQPRWLAGNVVEPAIRLTMKGSGLNVFGLTADLVATHKILKTLRTSSDPRLRHQAAQIEAQIGQGLFVGARGATVRRTLEEMPGHDAWGPMIAKLPIMRNMLEMSRALGHGVMMPANLFFKANRVIENVANRAEFGHTARRDMQSFTGSWTKSVALGQKAVEEAARGLTNTSTQRRYADSAYETLGKYTGFSPTMRALTQTIMPFIPWMLNATRFVFWTMPAHHTAKTALLQQASQAMEKDWEEIHRDTPPGNLRFAIPNGKGGWVDIARYTPWGAFTEAAGGGGGRSFTGQILPQLGGVTGALEGKDPFGRDLSAPPGEEPKPAAVAINSALEAMVPYVATARRLREGGATGYSTSTVLDPQTKPGTKHASALARTFSPLNPTYLRSPTGGGAAGPADARAVRRAQRSAAKAGASDAALERALRRARRASGGG